jgi:hypothetical protein
MTLFCMETRELLLAELDKIRRWEEDQKDLWFWEKLARFPFAVLDRITPRPVHDLLGKLLDELGSYIQTGGQYLVSDRNVLDKLAVQASMPAGSLALPDVGKLPLAVMDRVAKELKESRKQWATMQGATTGFGGFFTLAVDIPALLGLSLKVLQEMALAYGYDPREKEERVFIVKCLQFSCSEYAAKQAILKDLGRYCGEVAEREAVSELQGWREVIANYRDNYGWKKLFQLVPVIGIVFGAWINRSTVEEVAEAGQMLYKKRRVLEKLKVLEQANDEG